MHGRTVDDHTGRWGRCSRAIDVIGGGGAAERGGKEAGEGGEAGGEDALGPPSPAGALRRAGLLAAHSAAFPRPACASKRPCSPLAPRRGAPSFMCRWVELDYVDKGEGLG